MNLIIADPPYFEVKGDFDFIWSSFDEYLKDVERWAVECKRVLADNGCLFWYGDRKKIAYTQIILDKYFNLENNIYWQKAEKCQMEMFDTLTSFYCRGYERILFYSNEIQETGLDVVLKQEGFYSLMKYIKSERSKLGWNYLQVDEFLNIKASSCFWDKPTSHPYRIPCEEHWNKLQTTGFFKRSYESMRQEYEGLRQEYEGLRRPFDNYLKLSDHWHFTNDLNEWEHDTKKPITMTKHMIQTTTRKGDTVLIPFGGSGTELEACISTGRKYICYEISEKHYKTIKDREKKALEQPELFG